MGGCALLCDCISPRPEDKTAIPNPFRHTQPESSKTVYYYIEGPHPNVLKY